jgi:hypothetical protein
MNNYREVIDSKTWKPKTNGFEPFFMPEMLFDWQMAVVRWACKKGRSALFEDCGLGKTLQQIVWAENVRIQTAKNVIILCPLAVAEQTVREGAKIDIEILRAKTEEDIIPGIAKIYITNYDRLGHFVGQSWGGVVLDESSILKSFNGSTKQMIIDAFIATDYKLACTATPSPNDFTELGNHAEFLGVMTRAEMLCSFFINDVTHGDGWRLKGHAEKDFWAWVAEWAIMMRTPADIGFDASGYVLPELKTIIHKLESGEPTEGYIFAMAAKTLSDQRTARKQTKDIRIAKAVEIATDGPDACLVWCEMNEEGDILEDAIPDATQVAGCNKEHEKIDRMIGFSDGKYRCLVTKPKVAGFGMNWQHCNKMVFVGLSHSYEAFYQSVRRCHRFGQKRPVEVHIITTDIESDIIENIFRKQKDADKMAEGMIAFMSDVTKGEILGTERQTDEYRTNQTKTENWTANLGDCVEGIQKLSDNSVHYSIFSPPFSSLYTFSNSPFDMGNCKDHSEFFRQFIFLTKELHRVIMPGRLVSFHCMNLPTSKERDGFIGITDFRGILIKAFQDAGFIFHSEVCIWKDPVVAMQRTKALGLLHKQIKKDSCMSRQGLADYLVTMRKHGTNPERVSHTAEDLPVDMWEQYASPVWMDINPSDTLQRTSVREEQDERHISPLQLEVIRRALHLWSAKGDPV